MSEGPPPLPPASPYKGLVPYSIEDAPFFFGREGAREVISANLLASRLTLLYGGSGVGKSSLLRAGVAHDLRRQAREEAGPEGRPGFVVVVFAAWRDDPREALEAAIRQALGEALGAEEDGTDPAASLPLDAALETWTKRHDVDLFLILDQFEEYLLYHSSEDGDDPFSDQLSRAINRKDLRAHFLIAIREDTLAGLDRFKGRIPNLFDNYLRVLHLDRDAARDAIELPVAEHNRRAGTQVGLESGLVEAVLDQVATGRVALGSGGRGTVQAEPTQEAPEGRIETPYLQLVMQRLWHEEQRQGSQLLRLETLEGLGGAESIVRTHLDATMDQLGPEDQETAARIFHYLVTPSGTKIAHTAADLGGYTGLPEARVGAFLERLACGDKRILRPVASNPLAAPRYEIFHDVLAAAILDWRERYLRTQETARAEERAERERQRAEAQTREARRFRRLAAALALVLLAALGAGIYAAAQRFILARVERQSRSRSLSAAAVNMLHTDPERSLLLALYAFSDSHTPEAEDALQQAVATSRVLERFEFEHGCFNDVAMSPDASRLVTAGCDSTAAVRDAFTGEVLVELKGHSEDIEKVRFSPDGEWVATASHDGSARVWNARTGELERKFQGLRKTWVRDVAFSPDGSLLASGEGEGVVRLWNLGDGKEELSVQAHSNDVGGLAFSPGGSRLATGGFDNVARVWDVADGSLLQELEGHLNWVVDVAFSPDGERVASASEDDTARVWNVETGELVQTLWEHTNTVQTVEFPPGNPDVLVTSSWDRTAKLWDVYSGKVLLSFTGHKALVSGIAIHPDGSRLITASWDGSLRVWDLSTNQGPGSTKFAGHTDWIRDLAFNPQGDLLATASDDGTVQVWRADVGTLYRAFTAHEDWVYGMAFSPDGGRIATCSEDGTAKLWTLDDPEPLLVLQHDTPNPLHAVAFSPDGALLATGGEDSTIHLWDSTTGDEVKTLEGHTSWIRTLAFSPDGTLLASGSDDRSVKIWDTATWEELQSIPAHTDQLRDLAFNPAGTRLATAGDGGTLRTWDTATWESLAVMSEGHTAGITSLAFSPDGTQIATAGKDRVVILWDADSGRLHLTMPAGHGWLNAVAFSPDGMTVAAAGADLAVHLFSLERQDIMRTACLRVTRSFTAEECLQYLNLEQCPEGARSFDEIVAGKERARAGDFEGALAALRRASELNPGLGLDPEKAAHALVADHQAELGVRLAEQGRIDEALVAYSTADDHDPAAISVTQWNALCWNGALFEALRDGDPARVLPACDRGVERADARFLGNIRDSRAVARALSGDLEGAREDLEAYLAWSERPEVSRFANLSLRPIRESWLATLRSGEDPFTREVVASLLDE